MPVDDEPRAPGTASRAEARRARDFGLLDDYGAPPPPPEPASMPSARTWIGLGAMALIAAALSLSFERLATSAPASRGPVVEETPAPKAVDSLSVAASLASAAGALAEIESLRRRPPSSAPKAAPRGAGAFPGDTAEEPPAPPSPEDFPSPTDCMTTYLPGVEILDRSLDIVCEEQDLWSIEWKIHSRIAFRAAEGGRLWASLGRHTLAAIATLRAGCCKDPEPLEAAVPPLSVPCGALRDELRAFGPIPERPAFEAYDSTMTCLASRNVHLPKRWALANKEERDSAFRRFVGIARQRGR